MWSLPSACFSPGQAQQPPEGLKGSGSGAAEEQPQQGQNWVTVQRHSKTLNKPKNCSESPSSEFTQLL